MSRIVNLIDTLPWHPDRRWNKRAQAQIRKVILHQELSEGRVETVNRYHITPGPENHLSRRGAPHFAYHFGIRKIGEDGEIVQANHITDVTWHTRGQNAVGVGIMLEGNFKGQGHDLEGISDGPTAKQMAALEWLVDHLLEILHLSHQDVYGHIHYGKPACPGFVVTDWIEAYRNRSATMPEGPFREITSVKQLQQALEQLGYDVGDIDGKMGPKTGRAVRNFQRDQELSVDGVPGPQTRRRLLLLVGATAEV